MAGEPRRKLKNRFFRATWWYFEVIWLRNIQSEGDALFCQHVAEEVLKLGDGHKGFAA